jgi:phage shock protein A
MNIFERIATLLKSNINALISSAEDPEKILNQLIIDMRSQFLEARKQVAVAIADEKRLKRQYEKESAKAREWEKKAMTAVRAGRDDLARESLGRKSEADEISAQYQAQWQAQEKAAAQLKDALTRLNAKIGEASRKKNLLIARQKRAEAQQKIQDTMAGLSDNGAFDTFARMEHKVDQMEAEAEAAVELSGTDDQLESQLDALEVGQDDALAALKSKMGVAPTHAALPPAASSDAVDLEAIDAEIEALVTEKA